MQASCHAPLDGMLGARRQRADLLPVAGELLDLEVNGDAVELVVGCESRGHLVVKASEPARVLERLMSCDALVLPIMAALGLAAA